LRPRALIFWNTLGQRDGTGSLNGWNSPLNIMIRCPLMSGECVSQVTAFCGDLFFGASFECGAWECRGTESQLPMKGWTKSGNQSHCRGLGKVWRGAG
jgi:hypothetical protein